MIGPKSFVEAAKQAGFKLYTGVPCSYLKPFINYVIDSDDLAYVGAANEGDAVAIASGAEIAGKHAVVMFQNSGFGNAVNPITSLNAIFKIPVLVIATLRGEPGGPHDEPQHELMGEITTGLFDLMKVPWEYFPTEEGQIAGCLERALAHMTREKTPYGLVMKKDSVSEHKLQRKAAAREVPAPLPGTYAWPKDLPSRNEVLRAVQASARPTDAIVATTGFTGRELYACDDRASQLYMVGSMGCASTFGLGVAWAKPDRRVIVLDGDGAALMRLGALATLGYERPTNLVHVLLDNEVHESTGAQSTVSHSVDLAQVARACGYPRVVRAGSPADLEAILRADTNELTFVHAKIKKGVPADLPRPKVTPVEVANRFRKFLEAAR
ncbi:MAG: phosphonopyruvate decarboxylase [Myxococcales bacterium]|jgi:phosphonopyruvate decarboxylase|nr:phosphonopyruvate decarboxylase [Myxococcales bacterium]